MSNENSVVKNTKAIWLHEKLTEQIDKEFDLLGQRMTWLISGNAFLFTAFFVGFNIKTSNERLISISLAGADIPLVVLHPVEKLLALGCIAFLGCYICFVSLVAMSAARQVIAEMKKERFGYEVKIQRQLGYLFPITVPYRASGSHDIGNMMHRSLPGVVAFIWVVLCLVAFSSFLGPDLGPEVAVSVFVVGSFAYIWLASPLIQSVIDSISDDHLEAVEKNKRLVVKAKKAKKAKKVEDEKK